MPYVENTRKEFCDPGDLHKYTGSKETIPKDGFRAAPSYLDYPKKVLTEVDAESSE